MKKNHFSNPLKPLCLLTYKRLKKKYSRTDLPHYRTLCPHHRTDLPHYRTLCPHHRTDLPHYRTLCPHHRKTYSSKIIKNTILYKILGK